MTREIRRDLNKANYLYGNGKRQEAFEIYDRHYSQHPELFRRWDRIRYCWCIYYLFIENPQDDTELMENAERVTEIIRQQDLNDAPVCVYTQAVFSVIMFLKKRGDWEYMLYWLDKLDPKLLGNNEKESGDSRYPSKKEDYYKYLSMAYVKCGEYEDCLATSLEALDTIRDFAYIGDVWHMWRIAKSLNQLGEPEEALDYLNRVIESRQDWYILREMADCHYKLENTSEAIRYAGQSVLADGSARSKVNLYCLIYNILKDTDERAALIHAKLCLALKLESGAQVPDEIEDLFIDEGDLDIGDLESEVESYWSKWGGRDV